MRFKKTGLLFFFTIVFPFVLPSGSTYAGIADWSVVGSKKITLFYPGAASWEFLSSPDHSLGAKSIKGGKKPCVRCHVNEETGEYDIKADDMAAGRAKMKKSAKPFEPEPVNGKKGFLTATLQAAYDAQYLYLRFEWPSHGESFKNPLLAEKHLEDGIAVQLNKGHDYFKKYGCFVTCHNSLRSMPEAASKEDVKKHPYYGPLKRDDLRLYAFYTRDDGWSAIKEKKELDVILKGEGLIDVWESKFEGKNVKSQDGWVLEDRRHDDKNEVEAEGTWENGNYRIIFKRKLKTGDDRDVELKEGDTVTIGIAIHDDKTSFRRHYVSFPLTIGIGTDGDVRAEKTK